MKRINVSLLLILVISLCFRFYRNDALQYWNNDEEVHAWTVQRMILLRRPALVSPQPTLGASIGSFFHIASVPLFLIAKMDPRRIAEVFSIVGIGTTAVIYLLGKEVANRRTGLIASFLYATSFMAGLYDRRWWPITLTPLFSGMALLFVMRMVKNKSGKLLPLVALIAGSALHGDPAMLAVGVFAVIALIWYRVPLSTRVLYLSALVLLALIAPLIIFELKHPRAITSPLMKRFAQSSGAVKTSASKALAETFSIFGETVRLSLIPVPSNFLEVWFFPIPVLPWTIQNIVIALSISATVLFPLVLSVRRSGKKWLGMKLITLFSSVFFFSVLTFALVYKHQFQRVYLTIVFPVIFVTAGWLTEKISAKRKWMLAVILCGYVVANGSALLHSRLRYSLPLRFDAMNETLPVLTSGEFSLYVVGDSWLEISGITNLYTMAGFIPKKSYMYKPLDWLLRAHSLYFIEPTSEEGKRIVVMAPADFELPRPHVVYSQIFDTMKVVIYDNSDQWFHEKSLQQESSS